MADIKDIHEGVTVLGEFGIKVVGQVESSSDLPDPTEYDGEYGDAYVVGEEAPYDYYIFTRPFEDSDDPQWFNLGQFPAPGPQGETGETGATGATPAIVATATTSTLSAGQDASVTITKTGTDEEPHFTFAFEIPQGVQGIQGVQGAQGIQGPTGPQGIQGQKGDTGYLYTIIGQVNDESSLPLPGQVGRTSAFLVGTQEPYDVYIIIGQDAYDLEWLNIGPIATVVPTTYIASATDASSGTLDATTLAAINNETGVHYMRVGSELYEFANTYNGNAYYMSLRYDSSISRNKIARFIVALSSGAWTTGSDAIPDAEHTVFTNTDQTITGTKTFSGTINVGPAFRIGVSGTSPSEYYSLLRTGAYSEGIFFHTDGIAVGAKLYPGSNNTYDLGSSTNKWKDLWLSGYLRDGTNSILISDIATLSGTQTITGSKTFRSVIKADFTDVSLVGLNGVAGFRAYKPGTTTQAGQMIVTNDGTVPGSYRAVIQAYNGTQDKYNTLRIGDTEGFKYYIGNDEMFSIGNDGTDDFIKLGDTKLTETELVSIKSGGGGGSSPVYSIDLKAHLCEIVDNESVLNDTPVTLRIISATPINEDEPFVPICCYVLDNTGVNYFTFTSAMVTAFNNHQHSGLRFVFYDLGNPGDWDSVWTIANETICIGSLYNGGTKMKYVWDWGDEGCILSGSFVNIDSNDTIFIRFENSAALNPYWG